MAMLLKTKNNLTTTCTKMNCIFDLSQDIFLKNALVGMYLVPTYLCIYIIQSTRHYKLQAILVPFVHFSLFTSIYMLLKCSLNELKNKTLR